MEEWHILTIKDAFKRCYGLKGALGSQDTLLVKAALESLIRQTGFRKEFLKNHLEKIKKL